MKTFIELKSNEDFNFYLNINHIIRYFKYDEETTALYVSDREAKIYVKNTYEEVTEFIKQAL